MANVYLSLGSNIGDRTLFIQNAITRIVEACGEVKAVSNLYETKPWGVQNQDDFLNACLLIDTTLSPENLLIRVNKIEEELGRIRLEKWGARTIDIDILLYDDKIIESPNLIIPHPLMHQRSFVLIPLAEIAPNKRHPILNKTIAQLVKILQGASDVIRSF